MKKTTSVELNLSEESTNYNAQLIIVAKKNVDLDAEKVTKCAIAVLRKHFKNHPDVKRVELTD